MSDNMQEDYKRLLEESFTKTATWNKGDVVEGKIVTISDNHLFINLDGKYDAYADKADYTDDKGNLPYEVGSVLKGFIIDINDTGIVIAPSLNKSHVDKKAVKDAFEQEIPVKGKVFGQVKGGFSVDILGARAFCPISQIDLRPNDNPGQYLNRSFDFKIVEYSENGRNIIVSRKAILEKANSEKKDKIMGSIVVGATLKGIVTRMTHFGAFIDLGGIEGLLHVSEISWSHVGKPEEVLKAGEEIEVKVLKVDGEKISLSRRELMENPSDAAFQTYKEGDLVNCRVLRLQNFGAFVELSPGVEGLIPLSEMTRGRRINHPRDILKEGDFVEAQILRLDPVEKKISLSMKALQQDPWDNIDEIAKVGEEVQGIIENTTDFGIFVSIQDGVTGLLPRSRVPRGEMYQNGDSITLRVSSVDKESKRISLETLDYVPEERSPRQQGQQQSNTPYNPQDRDRRGGGDRKPRGRGSNDSEWKKYANEKNSVPEDNPFNKL
jgi:small subunit ribosomal protein S1